MHDLHELKEKLLKELEEYGGNAKFSKEDVETIKYMASAIDHICNISEDDGYSGYYPMMRGAYADGTMNVTELARICGLSRPTAYKYIKMMV